MIAAVVGFGGTMSSLDTTVVNVALDTVARDFGVSIARVQWVTTAYLLALATVIPVSGWASDRFGAKRVWMASAGLFLAGSMLAGAAWSLESLVGFRVLQGLGGAMLVPVGMTLVTRAAGPARMGRVMGVLGVPLLLGPVLGPVIGGILVEHAGWRWIFYVNVPVGALAIPLAARLLPREDPQRGKRFDARGFLLVSPGMAALVYGLAQGESSGGFAAPRTLVPILVGAVLLCGFVLHALRTPDPLIDVRMFRKRPVAAAVGTTFCLGMGLFGALFLLPLYYQGARGLSPLDAGLMMVPQGIGAAIMIPFAGRITDRIGAGPVVLGGLTMIVIGTLPFAFAGTSTPYPVLAVALVVRGLGMGASTMPAMAGAYAALDPGEIARAASALNVLRRLGGSLGVALLAVVLERGLPGSTGGVTARAAPTDVVADAFGQTFWWVVAFCALAFVPALFLPRRPAISDDREAVSPPARTGRTVGAGANA